MNTLPSSHSPPPSPSLARPTLPFPRSCLHEAPAPQLLQCRSGQNCLRNTLPGLGPSRSSQLGILPFSPLRGCQTCFWMYPSSKHFDMKSYSHILYMCVDACHSSLLSPWGPHTWWKAPLPMAILPGPRFVILR